LEKLLTIKEVSEIFRKTPKTIYLWIKEDKIKAVRIGSQSYLIKESEVNRILKGE
jgi:excisionase family DNA binding protein